MDSNTNGEYFLLKHKSSGIRFFSIRGKVVRSEVVKWWYDMIVLPVPIDIFFTGLHGIECKGAAESKGSSVNKSLALRLEY